MTIALVGLMLTSLFGCGVDDELPSKVVLTAGFGKDEIFRIEDMSCNLPEMMVYLTNIQDQYEDVYGSEIWDRKIDGVRLEDNIKEMALSKMAQVKAINLLAKEKGIQLDEDELALVEEATDTYYNSLNDTEIEKMGIDRNTIKKLYSEYALSEKLYRYIISDINPEISDDEARTITVQHILIKTYNLDEDGNRQDYSTYAKEDAYRRAEEVLKMVREDGADFEEIAAEYSEDNVITYSFGKGEMDAVFENAAFNLGNGEISDIVTTEYGYHIIKCLSTFNREVTDANKVKIVEERRNEAFGDEYDHYVESLTKDLNNELWEQVSFIDDPQVTTSDFFEVFDNVFKDKYADM